MLTVYLHIAKHYQTVALLVALEHDIEPEL